MQVSRVARQMVERFGFSKKIGQVAIGGPGGNPFLGQQVGGNAVWYFHNFTWICLLISIVIVITLRGFFPKCRCLPRKIIPWQPPI